MTEEIKDSLSDFRDRLGIITAEGKRRFIYPRKPSGRFYRLRTYFSYILLAILFVTPFIKINGHPFMLLNVPESKFIIFGNAFGTHDFFILALGVITFVVFIVLFTSVFGRVFCGWVCPQTVFLEMVFRKIENWIEGDYIRQKQFNESAWTFKKLMRKLFKWSIFFLISVLIANTLLAWIIGVDELFKIITEPVSQHTGGFLTMLGFSAVFYFIFAWFREYACIYVCPYGRLQGVLLDKDTTVIAYDFIRGEPRGKIHKSESRQLGDCIDCGLCTAVCPTGIDIRNGTQLECVNCAACIDACDGVMDRIQKPRGLIRYSSFNQIQNKTKFKFTAREKAYSIIFILLSGILTYLLLNRMPMDITLLRQAGMTYQEQPDNRISNLYTMKLANNTFDEIHVRLEVRNKGGEIKLIGDKVIVPPNDVTEAKFLVYFRRDMLPMTNEPVEIVVFGNGQEYSTMKIAFLAPR